MALNFVLPALALVGGIASASPGTPIHQSLEGKPVPLLPYEITADALPYVTREMVVIDAAGDILLSPQPASALVGIADPLPKPGLVPASANGRTEAGAQMRSYLLGRW